MLFVQSRELSHELFTSLREDFLYTDEGEADWYIGIKIKVIDEKLTIKQPQLIKLTIEPLRKIDANQKSVPVIKPLLGKKS